MKKLAWVLVLLICIVAGIFVSGPYITVAAIKTGIATGDAAVLTRYIDFPLLRQNLKVQLNSAAEKENDRASQNNMFSALMAGFKAKLIDSMVDSMVTPEGLANLMAGKRAASQQGDGAAQQAKPEKEDVFRDARFTFDSLESFSIWVPNESGGELRLVLQRQGLVWKLVNLDLAQTKRN